MSVWCPLGAPSEIGRSVHRGGRHARLVASDRSKFDLGAHRSLLCVTEEANIRVEVEPAEVRLGRLAARVPAGTPEHVLDELRRLLLAEHAMEAVQDWANARALDPPPLDRFKRSRLVDAAGLTAMFSRPFAADDKRERLDPAYWEVKLGQIRPDLAALFSKLRGRRNRVFAHADTRAGMINVINSHKMLRESEPSDPIDLRTYDVGAADELLDPAELARTSELAAVLSGLFEKRMAELGAVRVRELQ